MDATAVMYGEVVHVPVGDVSDYEEGILSASARLAEFVHAPIHRDRDDAGQNEWYVCGCHGDVSLGGNIMQMTVAFARAGHE